MNPILCWVDGYKLSHYNQFPPKTTKLFYYYESRGGAFENIPLAFQEFYIGSLTEKITHKDIVSMEELYKKNYPSLPFYRDGWNFIATWGKGKLPISIRSLPLGIYPPHIPLFTVESTSSRVPWVAGWVETYLSLMWYPLTVGALSLAVKNILTKFLSITSDLEGEALNSVLLSQLHDFGARGVSSMQSGIIGGAAHLLHFKGSDTVASSLFSKGANVPTTIPSMEHSTITSWGREKEEDAYYNMIMNYGNYPAYGIVVDSYDMWNAIENILGKKLKAIIDAKPGTLVVRLDSGDPPTLVPLVLHRLASIWGVSTNSKGYKVLNPKVRVLWGDGLSLESILSLLSSVQLAGFSSENIFMGMGGGLLQKVNRDTCKFAYKCSAIKLEGDDTIYPVYKDPSTDASKKSRGGLLWVDENLQVQSTTNYEEWVKAPSLLQECFRDGEILIKG